MNDTSIQSYVIELKRELRKRGIFESRIVEESRNHLADAVEEGRRRGLALKAAEHEAMKRFGAPAVVAARFAAEKYSTLHRGLLAVAVVFGIAIAYIDSRPKWDDAGITAFSMMFGAGILGLVAPRRPWIWALGIGIWIPLHGFARTPTLGSFVGGLVILAFPIAGAYGGMLFRRMIATV
jgi:hypothetical protein